MYILSIAIVVLTMLLAVSWGGSIFSLLDIPSLVIVFTLSFSLLGVSGLWKDFRRALRISYSKENMYELDELKKSELAIKTLQYLFIGSGFFGTLLGFIMISAYLSDISALAPSIGVASLTLFYSLVVVLILMPVRFKIKTLIIEKEYESKID